MSNSTTSGNSRNDAKELYPLPPASAQRTIDRGRRAPSWSESYETSEEAAAIHEMMDYVIFFLIAYGIALVAYLLPNGFFYWLFWIYKRDAWSTLRIQKDRQPKTGQVRREIKSSLSTLAVHCAIGTFVYFLYRNGYTSLTTEPPIHPVVHLLSLLGLMLLHDTWFYWMHRLLHTRLFFRVIHKEHHDSIAPTPWATYSNTAWETLAQCPLWVCCFTIPVHPYVVITLLLLENIYNTFGHLGYEFFPSSALKNRWLSAIQATPTHHEAHHRYFRGNYSHWFNIWDRLMGTEVPQYGHMLATAYDKPTKPTDKHREAA